MIGRDQADATFECLLREPSADHDVGLKVNDIRLELIENPGGIVLDRPGQGEAVPRMRIPAPAAEAVDHHICPAVLLDEDALATVVAGWCNDSHLVAAAAEAAREAGREGRRTVDLRCERVRADEDLEGRL